MLASRVVVANPSVDTMSTASENSAQIYLVKSSISVMEGLECVNHLNNILSTDITSLDKGMRMDGLICDSNGRVTDIVNCYHMGQSILIVGIDSNTDSTRELLTKGIPWNQNLSLLDGNGVLEHLRIIGHRPSSLVESLYPELSELFIVEGDSAGGSAKQSRERKFQAIMPLRGKILNTWDLESSEIMKSVEIKDIATAIGVNPGSSDIESLRYGKICILADADSDGLHIATLLCALFLRHFKPLIQAGHIFVAMPPLFRIDCAKEVFYALDAVSYTHLTLPTILLV